MCLLMLIKMKKAFKDLTAAHFAKNLLRMRNLQFSIFFFYKIRVFTLKETQTFKAYYTESYKYCFIIAVSNTKILKTYSLLKKI